MSGRPWARQLIVPTIMVVFALGAIGTALTPELAVHHPLLLIALEARDRHLLLARHVAPVPYFVVGTLRRLSTDPLFYLLGRGYGADAVAWLRAHGGGGLVDVTERAFRRAAYPMLVVFPGAVVCTLAGEVGVPPALFGAIIVVRTVVTVALLRLLGNALATPIDAVLGFFNRYDDDHLGHGRRSCGLAGLALPPLSTIIPQRRPREEPDERRRSSAAVGQYFACEDTHGP